MGNVQLAMSNMQWGKGGHSIGIVTALNPYIGYEASASVAREALETGASVYDLILKHNLLTKEKMDEILSPENMLHPGYRH